MKWLRMSILHFERVVEFPFRSLIWMLIPISNNLALLLFWAGSTEKLSYITSYYLIMTIGSLFLVSHVENDVAEIDIKQGELVNYLTKPVSYYWINFLNELPYRVTQAFYGMVFIGICIILFHGNITLAIRPIYFPLALIIFALGYFISYTFKLCIAYLSFWFTDLRGMYELIEIFFIVFSGSVMPLEWYPPFLRSLSTYLPFAYSGYYPIISLIKPLALIDFLHIILAQGAWLGAFLLIHQYLWKQGIKEFTAVGQ